MKPTNILLTYWNKDIRDKIATFCCLTMIAGLFFSRALLSISMFVMFVNALHPDILKENLNIWKRNAFAMLSFAFFLTYLLSGLWSSNYDFWLASVTNKLPFVILPFAFCSAPLDKPKYQQFIIIGLVFMQVLVVGNSLIQFGFHSGYYLKGYHFSRPLPTTRYGDHIRFSLSLVMAIFLICYTIFEQKEGWLHRRWIRLFLTSSMVLFIVYLHILAAKTGLICLYTAGIIYIISRMGKKRKMLALILALALASLPLIAYYAVPTFRTKIDYVFYEIAKSKENKRFDYSLSDAGRMITYEIGGKAIVAHPVIGVGAGDIMDIMKVGYKEKYPEADQIYGPINQFMFTALCVGIPLMLVLVAMVLAPVFKRREKNVYLSITVLVMVLSMMVESMLELQFGVFTYLFFTLLWIGIIPKPSLTAKVSS